MFTGIVQAIGRIVAVEPVEVRWGSDASPSSQATADAMGVSNTMGRRLTVDLGNLDAADIQLGDSIAINGACMTVVALQAKRFQVDVSAESLRCTVRLDQEGPVNLEKAMRANDRLGGHMVSGHVDGTAEVIRVMPIGESWCLEVRIPAEFSALVSEKGSIAIDGVSLTINTVVDGPQGTEISINLIPHTWQATTLHQRKPGDRVNMEVDQLAKHVARIVQRMSLTH